MWAEEFFAKKRRKTTTHMMLKINVVLRCIESHSFNIDFSFNWKIFVLLQGSHPSPGSTSLY